MKQEPENILNSENNSEDYSQLSLRPQNLSEFIGQTLLKENLSIFIESAKERSEPLDHVLVYGPPGLGKTTIAQIIAKEMSVNFRSTSAPILSKAGDLAAILTNLEKHDILFIDEIHRLTPAVEEMLYSAMEDFSLDIIIGEGPAARTVKIDLPKFTLVGATTRIGLISNPLRDRFGIPLRLNFYNHDDLSIVITKATKKMQIKCSADGALKIAKSSRGTPRIALRLLKRIRDFITVAQDTIITEQNAAAALDRLNVDSCGLDSSDHRYMMFIIDNYLGGPVGVETICAGLSESRDTIEDSIEPYLIQQGFINRTPRGRVITQKAYQHLNIERASKDNNNLF